MLGIWAILQSREFRRQDPRVVLVGLYLLHLSIHPCINSSIIPPIPTHPITSIILPHHFVHPMSIPPHHIIPPLPSSIHPIIHHFVHSSPPLPSIPPSNPSPPLLSISLLRSFYLLFFLDLIL